MDKFDRRPNARQTRRKTLLAVVAFSLSAIWFGSMFAFGNAAAPWAILAYVILLGSLSVAEGRAYMRRMKLWHGTLKVRPEHQGPGYSALEQAALAELLNAPVWELGGAVVQERYNSGHGCVVTLAGPKISPPSGAFDRLVCFRVEGVEDLVGACLWPDEDGRVALLEFFTVGDTSVFGWSQLDFEQMDVPAGMVRPSMAPVVSKASVKRFHYEG